MKKIKLKILERTHGQALVEFALVLPVFIVILMGIIEFGRLWETMNVVTSAAREGARVAAIVGANTAQVSTAANRVLSSANITGATVSVSGPTSDSVISVSVRISYTPITGGLVPGLTGIFNITRTSTMRWEG